MRRGLKNFISLNALKHLPYIPIIIFKLKNWLPFLLNYIGFKNPGDNIYIFRNGTKIKTKEEIDSTTIAVVFIKKDYGDVTDNSIVIDIGANIGVYSIFAASTSKNTIVYAYEPMPENYDLFLENIKTNKLEKNIIPFKLGVGSKTEKRKLFVGWSSPFHSLYSNKKKGEYLEIKCTSFKDIFDENKIEQCDVLKMDCEGAEFEILYNTPGEYLKKIKEIRMEYHNIDGNKDYNIQRLTEFLEENGFKTVKLGKNPDVVMLSRSSIHG
jgi:FkbM family methyltransferase